MTEDNIKFIFKSMAKGLELSKIEPIVSSIDLGIGASSIIRTPRNAVFIGKVTYIPAFISTTGTYFYIQTSVDLVLNNIQTQVMKGSINGFVVTTENLFPNHNICFNNLELISDFDGYAGSIFYDGYLLYGNISAYDSADYTGYTELNLKNY